MRSEERKSSLSSQPCLDHYPFGWEIKERSFSTDAYRFGFNGMEKNPEINSGSYTTEYRQLDTRIGRWASADPLMSKFPNQSPYNFGFNNPAFQTDKTGAAPDDWIRNRETGRYEWREEVTSVNVPEGFDYVGETGSYEADNGKVVNLEAGGGWSYAAGYSSSSGHSINGLWNAGLRGQYAYRSYKLKPLYNMYTLTPEHVAGAHQRTGYLNYARDRMIGGRDYLDAVKAPETKLGANPKTGKNPRFYRTNPGINVGSAAMLPFAVYGTYTTGENLFHAASNGYLSKQIAVENNKWGGSMAGMRLGAHLVMKTPIKKNAVASILTVGITGFGGSILGEQATYKLEATISPYTKYLSHLDPLGSQITSFYKMALFDPMGWSGGDTPNSQ